MSNKDQKENSYSHILDDITTLKVIQNQEEMNRDVKTQNQRKNMYLNSSKDLNQQYGQRQLKEHQDNEIDILIENMKNDILKKIQELKPKKSLPSIKQNLSKYKISLEDSQEDQYVYSIPLEELNHILLDYSKQIPQNKLIQAQFKEYERQIEEQNALQFLSKYNPDEYNRIISLKMLKVKEEILEGLGLGSQFTPITQSHKKQDKLNIESQFNLGYGKNFNNYNHKSQIIQFNQRVNNNLKQYDMYNYQGIEQITKLNKQLQFIVSRYNRYITAQDLVELKNEGILNQTMLDFFIKYLQEKQNFMINMNMDKQKQVFFLTSKFYLNLTKGGIGTCDYESSKNFTSIYTGKNNSIFEKFDVGIIPIIKNLNDCQIVFINFSTRTIKLVDTYENNQGFKFRFFKIEKQYNRQERAEILNNPILQSILKFLEFEYNTKFMRNFDLLKWKFEKVEGIGATTPNQSCLCAAYIIYHVSRKFSLPFDIQNKLPIFSQNLLSLFQSIGVTKNKKNELDNKLKDFPL